MTRVLSLTLILMVSFSSASAQQQTATESKEKVVPSAAQTVDSPLAAAAKRTGRLGKKPDFVITNETLKASGGKGHVTTTAMQQTLNLPKQPEPPPKVESEWEALQKKAEADRAAAAAQAAAKAREEKRILALAAAAAEDGYLDDLAEDPAAAEQRLRELEQELREHQRPEH